MIYFRQLHLGRSLGGLYQRTTGEPPWIAATSLGLGGLIVALPLLTLLLILILVLLAGFLVTAATLSALTLGHRAALSLRNLLAPPSPPRHNVRVLPPDPYKQLP